VETVANFVYYDVVCMEGLMKIMKSCVTKSVRDRCSNEIPPKCDERRYRCANLSHCLNYNPIASWELFFRELLTAPCDSRHRPPRCRLETDIDVDVGLVLLRHLPLKSHTSTLWHRNEEEIKTVCVRIVGAQNVPYFFPPLLPSFDDEMTSRVFVQEMIHSKSVIWCPAR
jgi:hypothetical protein